MASKNHGIYVFDHADEGAMVAGIDRATIRWVGTVTVAQTAVIKDVDGNKIWESVAPGTQVNDTFSLKLNSSIPLVITKLDAGTLYIYQQ